MRALDHAAQTGRWRRIPAIEKAVFSVGVMALSLGLAGWSGQILLFSVLLILTFGLARISFGIWVRAVIIPMGFLLMSMVALLISVNIVDGHLTLALVSPADQWKAGFIAFRSFVCVCALLFLALTTPLADILRLFQRMGLPSELTEIAFLMLRFIWLLFACLETGQRAQVSRLGHRTFRRHLVSASQLAAGLLPRALDRARRMTAGLNSRAWNGGFGVLSRTHPTTALRMGFVVLGLVFLGALVGGLKLAGLP